MLNYLSVENLTKYYGEILLFDKISFGINKDQKVALVAKNGTGKSTLMRILFGNDIADEGNVSFRNGITIGYLEQDPVLDPNHTILEEALSATSPAVTAVREYEEAIIENKPDKIQKCIEAVDTHEAWDLELKVKQILSRLKLDDFSKKISTCSGGQKKRVALAKILIDEPEFLILDEPTNHLDLEMIEWLEEYLEKTKSTLFMVTHDRYFLDRVCDEILELDDKTLYPYKGNFTYYIEKRGERLSVEKAKVEKARNLYKTELEWIRRMPQARATKAKYRIDAFDSLKKKAFKNVNEEDVKIKVGSARLGTKIIETRKLTKSFGELKIMNEFTYKFGRNEKIGIIGKNGSGKSTFLNLITGQIPADSGTIDIGETVKIGYYKQDGMKLAEDKRVIDVAREIAEVVTMTDGSSISVSQFLHHFLFDHDVQYAYVSTLSGGEKRRLYLLTVLMRNPNFLILDEPTNDLDIQTLSILEEYLIAFPGCVIVVTHDRFFMDKIVDHVFVFHGEGSIKDFPGNYAQYREYALKQEREEKKLEKSQKEEVEKPKSDKPKKRTYKEKIEFEKLEKELEELEEKKSDLEAEISSGSLSNDDLLAKSNELGELMKTIDDKTDRWLELSELE